MIRKLILYLLTTITCSIVFAADSAAPAAGGQPSPYTIVMPTADGSATGSAATDSKTPKMKLDAIDTGSKETKTRTPFSRQVVLPDGSKKTENFRYGYQMTEKAGSGEIKGAAQKETYIDPLTGEKKSHNVTQGFQIESDLPGMKPIPHGNPTKAKNKFAPPPKRGPITVAPAPGDNKAAMAGAVGTAGTGTDATAGGAMTPEQIKKAMSDAIMRAAQKNAAQK